MTDDYEFFKSEIDQLTGINLSFYKEKQMKRRIDTLIARKGKEGYLSYLMLLQKDPRELAAFTDYITINVTEFFRTPDHWAGMEEEALPELAKRGSALRIWSSACSTGEEPYSLAISLLRRCPDADYRILATDIDEGVLKKAERGFYAEAAVSKLSEEEKELYFRRCEGGYEIDPDLRSRISFRRLDLLKEPYPQDCDLIVCRNVLIYFTEEAKRTIYEKFRESLRPGGILFTGNTEQLIQYKALKMEKLTNFLYRRPEEDSPREKDRGGSVI